MSTDSIFTKFLESFKTKSPKLFLFIAFLLSVAAYTAQQGELLGIIPLTGIWQKITVGISWLLAIVTGVQTTTITVEQYQNLETQLALLTDRHAKLKEEYEAIDFNNARLTEAVSDRDIQIQSIIKEKDNYYARWTAAQNNVESISRDYNKVVTDLETASTEINTLYALRDSLEAQLKACKESPRPTVSTTNRGMTADYKVRKDKK